MSKLYQADTLPTFPPVTSSQLLQPRKTIDSSPKDQLTATKPHSRPTQSNDKFSSHLKPYKNKKTFSVSVNKFRTQSSLLTKDPSATLLLANKSLYSLPSSVHEKASILQVLDLSHNNLEYFPLEITGLVHLTTLKMNYNRIKSLPLEIFKLVNMEYFSIVHNKIQNLPSTLQQLTRLSQLNLEANLIKVFGEEVTSLPSLERLNIYQNRIKYIPASFSNLQKLCELRFEWIRYVDPSSSCYLREEEGGEAGLKKIRMACEMLTIRSLKSLTFRDFLRIFSESQQEPQLMNTDTYGCSLLHLACLYEDISVIKQLMIEAPDLLDMPNSHGLTPFCFSVLKEKRRSSYYLLKHGANPTKGSSADGDPLHIATRRLNTEIVKGILRLGVNPNKADPEGNMPLHYAVALLGENTAKAGEIVQFLVDYGADTNIKNKDGWSPIHIVARRRDVKAIEWMISYNFEMAEVHGRADVFKLEIGGGSYNWTPLHIAAYSDSVSVVKAFGERGVSMFEQSVNGYTAKRLINVPGLSLKMIEKYEKEWIKKNILNKKLNVAQEEIIRARNLGNVGKRNIIQNASKNIFGDNLNYEEETFEDDEEADMFQDLQCEEDPKPFSVNRTQCKDLRASLESSFAIRLSTRARMSRPITEPNEYKSIKESRLSLEVLPETENNTVEHSLDDMDESNPDICGLEVNENVNIEASMFNRKDAKFLPLQDMKLRLSKALARISRGSEAQESSEEEILELHHEEGNQEIQQTTKVIDLEKHSSKLSFAIRLGLDFFKTHIASLVQTMMQNDQALPERIKILSVFNLAYKFVSEQGVVNTSTLKESHRRNASSFSERILPENQIDILRRGSIADDQAIKVPFNKRDGFIRVISNALINIFQELQPDLVENNMIKRQICQIFGHVNSSDVLTFLEKVGGNMRQPAMVRFEAAQALKTMGSRSTAAITISKSLPSLKYKLPHY